MAANIEDVLRVNFVLVGFPLLSTQEETDAFRQAVGTEIAMAGAGLVTNIPSGVTEPGRTFTLNRDRITLDLSTSRSMINRDYPSREDLTRLSEIADLAIKCTNDTQQPRAFGFNVDLVFDQDSCAPALSYLGERLFKADLGNEGWKLFGGSGKLTFADNNRRWMVTIEPRFGEEDASRVYFSLNLHHNESRLPTKDEIWDSLGEVWDQAYSFVQRLG